MNNTRYITFAAAAIAIAAMVFGTTQMNTQTVGAVLGGPTTLCPLGWYAPDPNTSQCSTAFGYEPSVAGVTTNVFAIQGLTPGDSDFVTTLINVQAPGATDENGRAWFRYKWGFTYRLDGSAFADPTGATTPTLVDSQIGSGLSGTTVNLIQNGSTLTITTNCATAGSCATNGSVDWFRNASSPWVLSVSPTMAYASPTSPTLLTITTTPGATNNLTGLGCVVPGAYAGGSPYVGCTHSSYALQNCVQQSQTTATCFLPAGSYTAGVDSVCLQSGSNPFCLVSGFTLDAAAPADSGAADSASGDAGSILRLATSADLTDGGYGYPSFVWAPGGQSILFVTSQTVASCSSATICGNAATVGAITAGAVGGTSLVELTTPACGAGTCTSATNGGSASCPVVLTCNTGTLSSGGIKAGDVWYQTNPDAGGIAWSSMAMLTTTNPDASAQTVVASALDWVTNTYTATPLNAPTAPDYHATGGGTGSDQPYVHMTTTIGNQGLFNNTVPSVASGLVSMMGAFKLNAAGFALFSSTSGAMEAYQTSGTVVDQYQSGGPANSQTVANGTTYNFQDIFNGASSSQTFNGTLVSGGNPGAQATNQRILWGQQQGSSVHGMNADMFDLIYYPFVLNSTAAGYWRSYHAARGIGL
jgi:hypothetical protein